MPEACPPKRPSPAGPADRIRATRPESEVWRADGLVGSRHTRWIDELRQPIQNHDLDHARRICAEISRLALQDFAPALLLLPRLERERAQALTAYTLTLLDFVRQTGLEGERLAAINRWEFELESTLDGRPPGQPVFVLLHHLEQVQPWEREGFDHLHTYARRRCALPRPATARSAESNAVGLAEALTWILTGATPSRTMVHGPASVIRLHGLMTLGDDLRRHRPQLPMDALPENFDPANSHQVDILKTAIEKECLQVRGQIGSPEDLRALPTRLQPAARYCWLASGRILDRIDRLGPDLVENPPHLGLWPRLTLLLHARWGS